MEEVLMSTDHYMFTTTTAEVMPPNDFVVELKAVLQDMNQNSVIKINNLDELMDFLENTDW